MTPEKSEQSLLKYIAVANKYAITKRLIKLTPRIWFRFY